jgi:hypothetical protein
LIDIIGVFIETWGRKNINLTIVSIPRKQVPLNECLGDVNMVAMHAVLCGKGENHAEEEEEEEEEEDSYSMIL